MAKKRRFTPRCALLCTALAISSAVPACGGSAAKPAKVDRGVVNLQCDIPDAEVWVDGRYFREAGELKSPFRLRPGDHRIEVRHQGFHSMYYELSVEAGSRHTLRVQLAKRLP